MSKRQSKVLSFSPSRKAELPAGPEDQFENPINYYVKFFLSGLKQQLSHKVHKNDWDAVSLQFWEHKDTPTQTLVDFIDIQHDTLVRVNPKSVVLYQALYDAGEIKKTKRPGADAGRITIYVSGLSKALHFDNMEAEDVASLNEGLDCFQPDLQEFVNFTDEDGEENSIRVLSIIAIETPNLTMFDGSVTSWNPATQENEDPHISYEDEEDENELPA